MSFQIKNHQISRWYLLRTTNQYPKEISLSLFGGLSQKEKTFFSIKQEGGKAFRAGYKRLLLAWNFVFHSEKEQLAKWILEKPQAFALSVHKKSFTAFKKMFEKHNPAHLLIDLFLENFDENLLKEVESLAWPFQITISAHKRVNLKHLSDSLAERDSFKNKNVPHPYIFMHFPCYHKKHSQLYSSEEMYNFLKKNFYPPPQIDIYNLSIPEDLDLEPEQEPRFSHHISDSKPKASVIIPTYNCSQELCVTLKHLFQQDLDKKNWEVIVVDDGSEDETSQNLKNLDFLPHINFKFLLLSRQYKRENFADFRFRAGIARNVGVKQAQGQYLLFLVGYAGTFFLSVFCMPSA